MNAVQPAPDARTLRILFLEDSALDAELVEEHLHGTGLPFALERVVSREDYLAAVRGKEYDLILADFALPAFDGMTALALAQEHCVHVPFVFVSATLGEEVAVEALKRGATDYVLKQRLERLPGTVLRALAEAAERAERRKAEEAMHRLIDEKTALLHELDHRVKNNLQTLLALIALEIRRCGGSDARPPLERLRRRLSALATVHRQLYGGERVDRFDAAQFARELTADLSAASGRSDIRTEYELQPVFVSAQKAAPVALVMSELVSNALAHAYQHRQGKLRLEVHPLEEGCVLQISDDEFTAAEKKAAREGTTGDILTSLARQLGATIEWPAEERSVLVRAAFPTGETTRSREGAGG
jgi:two-component sensor histidine kinase